MKKSFGGQKEQNNVNHLQNKRYILYKHFNMERTLARMERYQTENNLEGIIDMTLDNIIIKYESVPQYLKDFYSETTLSDEWIALSNEEKEKILDDDLKKYMNSGYFTNDQIKNLYNQYGNNDYPVACMCKLQRIFIPAFELCRICV